MTWQGFALVLCGAFLFALYEVINKKLLVKQAPADCISTVNFLGGGSLLLLVSFLFAPPQVQNWFSFHGGLFWPLLATGLLNIVILFGNVRALKYGDVSLIGPISATQPMIVLIPSYLILREEPTTWGYFGLLLMAVGMYVFSFAEDVKGWTAPKWLAWMGKSSRYLAPWVLLFKNKGVRIALLCAACGAVAINFDKMSTLRSSATFAPACILLFCGAIGALKTLKTNEWKSVDKSHLWHMVTNPIIFAIVLICWWSAFHYGLAAYVGALKRTTVVFALILSFILLGEQKVKKRWPGATIMASGAALLSL